MSDKINVLSSASISEHNICEIYVELWKLEQMETLLIDKAQSAAVRRIVRKIREALSEVDIEIIDYVGQPYDPGMLPEVLDIETVESAEGQGDFVAETIEPTLLWRGNVLRAGQVIIRRVTSADFSED